MAARIFGAAPPGFTAPARVEQLKTVTRIDLIFFDAGGGHRAAARALSSVIEGQQRPWLLRLVNLQELLDPIDLFHEVSGLRLQDIYNLLLKKGWTLGASQLCRLMQLVIRAYHSKEVSLLKEHWRRSQPDLVVSVVPHFNRAMFESLRQARPQSPFVTILTDLVDYPPHFWIERQEQLLICGTEHAAGQAKSMDYPDERIFRTSGMILDPRFHEPVLADRGVERRRLGLEEDRATALVLFGGEGARGMLDITRRLDQSGLPVQLILICGRNDKLARELKKYAARIPMFVEGFTNQVPYYMHLADFMIGKPGPGSISEALAMKLPVIVQSNAATLPQERYNARWVLEKEVGFVVSNFRRIEQVAGALIEPATLARYRANAARIQNRAVFEIPEILERILKPASPATNGAGSAG
jgi:1,2-diacylglycerol 3-beta-galactosyltransferase